MQHTGSMGVDSHEAQLLAFQFRIELGVEEEERVKLCFFLTGYLV